MHLIEDHAKKAEIPLRFAAGKLIEGDERVLQKLELDENDHIKGWDNRLADLKTQFPKMFEAAPGGSGGFKPIDTGRLPGGDGGGSLTRNDILKKPYAERQKLYEENPEAYNAAMNGK